MALRKAKVGPTQKLVGYAVLTVLGLITVWLLIQQSRFNPAVIVASRGPLMPSRPQAVAAQTPAASAALIPEVSGFTPLGASESYGPDNLSDKIDGKAELYLSAGFKEMSCRSFGLEGSGGAHVEIFIYDMGSPQNAFAVFSGQRRSGSPSIPLTANAYTTSNALFFTQGRFYVEIVADRATPTLPNFLGTYATALLAKLPAEGGTMKKTVAFPPEGLTPDSVRLCPTDVFCLEGLNNVLTGEYSLKSGTGTGFMAERDTPEQARAEAKRYLDFLDANGYKKITAPGVSGDVKLVGLDNSYEAVFVQGKTMAGVHDATSVALALELTAKLRAALKEKP
jgi:hypothetical protein